MEAFRRLHQHNDRPQKIRYWIAKNPGAPDSSAILKSHIPCLVPKRIGSGFYKLMTFHNTYEPPIARENLPLKR